MVHLPFKEDVREVVLKDAEELPLKKEAVDLAESIVTKLKLKYDPKNFPNPVLQTHWRTVEALALNEDEIKPFDDSQTQPNYDWIESEAGYDMYSLNQILGAINIPVTKKISVSDDLSEFAKNGKVLYHSLYN